MRKNSRVLANLSGQHGDADPVSCSCIQTMPTLHPIIRDYFIQSGLHLCLLERDLRLLECRLCLPGRLSGSFMNGRGGDDDGKALMDSDLGLCTICHLAVLKEVLTLPQASSESVTSRENFQ